MGQQRPACKGLADGILGEHITAWTEHQGSLIEATRGQRDVPRDYNVVRRDMLNNPVIDSVELPFDNHKFDPVPIRNANPRVGDHGDVESVSLRHSVHFLLYGAAIGIDEYVKHFGPFLPSVSPARQITPLLCILLFRSWRPLLHLHNYIGPDSIQARNCFGLGMYPAALLCGSAHVLVRVGFELKSHR